MAVDERLRRALEEAGRPADPSGVYEHLIRRRERQRVVRRLQVSVLTVVVIAGSIAGIYGLTRVFEPAGRPPGLDPSPVPVTHENGLIAFVVDGELHAMLPDGSGDRVIPTPPDSVRSAVWSPDGDRLAVVTVERGELGLRGLWVMESDGSSATRIAREVGLVSPSWSPDGATIAYATLVDRRAEVHLAAPDGSSDRMVYGEPGEGLFPIHRVRISPDGRTILFDRRLDSGASIVAMNVDGTNVRPLTSTGTDFDPSWSPDGLRIAFTRVDTAARPSPTTDIYVMNANGSDVRQLTDGGRGGVNSGPEWSPDGTTIAYLTGLDQRTLVIMNADGSEPIELTGIDVGPLSWQPVPTSDSPVEPTPTEAPSGTESPPPFEDVGLGFPVCDVTSVRGRFDAGIDGTAYVATRMGDTGGCPPLDGATQVLAVDLSGDGLPDASYGPLECDQWCNAFATPDVDGDGIDELLIQNIQFSIRGLKLFDVQAEHAGGRIVPVTVLPPGSPPFGYQGFEGDTEPQFWLGGDAGSADAIRCESYQGSRAFVSVTSDRPIEGADHIDVTSTMFVLEIDRLRVVDVEEFDWPINDDVLPFLQTDGCGASLPYP